MRARTLEDMVADCRKRADMENSEFVTDNEITEILNQELAELENHIWPNQDKPFRRNLQTYTLTSDPLDSLQPLPFDFLSVQEVMADYNGVKQNITPFMAAEHSLYLNSDILVYYGPPKYRIQAGNIEIVPVNQAMTVYLWYTPCLSRLVNPSDIYDGVNGWEVAAIYGTVAQMLQKEESDYSLWESRKERMLQRVDAWAAKRDAANPERVQETVPYDNGIWWGPFGGARR